MEDPVDLQLKERNDGDRASTLDVSTNTRVSNYCDLNGALLFDHATLGEERSEVHRPWTDNAALEINNEPTLAFAYTGVIALLSWNLMLTTAGYWDLRLGSNWATYSAPAYSSAQVLGQASMVAYSKLSSFHQLVTSLLGVGMFLLLMPLCATVLRGDAAMVACLLCIFLLGLASSVYQCSCFALCANLPRTVVIYMSTGQGVAGILTALLSLSGDMTSTSVWICFSIVSAIISGSAAQYLYFQRHPMVKPLLTTAYEHGGASIPLQSVEESEEADVRPRLQIYRDASPMAASVFAVFLVTFVVFPSVTTHWQSNSLSTTSFQSRLMAVFPVCDVAGRYAPSAFECAARYARAAQFFVLESRAPIVSLVFARILFIPLFLYIQHIGSLDNDAWKYISMMVFAFTNGWACSLCIVHGPLQVQSPKERDLIGVVMSFALTTGIFFGSMLGLLTQE